MFTPHDQQGGGFEAQSIERLSNIEEYILTQLK